MRLPRPLKNTIGEWFVTRCQLPLKVEAAQTRQLQVEHDAAVGR